MTAAMYYMRPFNLTLEAARTPLGLVTIRRSGSPDIAVDIAQLSANDAELNASNWFWHFFHSTTFTMVGNDPAATTRYPHFATSSLARALNLYVQGQQTALGWPAATFEAIWNEELFGAALPHYAFTNSSAITYQFSTAAGAALFGATGTALSSPSAFHTLSACVPKHVVFPNLQKITATDELDARNKEPEGVASAVVSDSGAVYGNARLTSYYHRDWQQRHEVLAKADRDWATAAHPTTFQHLFAECRSHTPFCVAHGSFVKPNQYECFVLRGDGNNWSPNSASRANHAQTHIDFRTIAIGSLQTPT